MILASEDGERPLVARCAGEFYNATDDGRHSVDEVVRLRCSTSRSSHMLTAAASLSHSMTDHQYIDSVTHSTTAVVVVVVVAVEVVVVQKVKVMYSS